MAAPIDTFDELAALFLTEPDVRPTRRGNVGPDAVIELLLIGHLPVRGSLWIGPFADALARERGPTALLRLNEDEPSVELFRSPSLVATDESHEDLVRVVRAMADSVGTWLIRPATTTAMDLVEAQRLTVLTGADEAAAVALYQTLKEVAEAAKAAGRVMPAVSLAVVGCERERARDLVERVNRTASTFLGVQVELGICVPQIDAGIRSTGYQRFRGTSAPNLRSIIEAIRARSAAIRTVDAAARSWNPRLERAPMAGVAAGAAAESAGPPWSIGHKTAQVAAAMSVDAVPGAVMKPSAATHAVKLQPSLKPAARIFEPKAAAPAEAASASTHPAPPLQPDHQDVPAELADHVTGVTLLAVRCPGHEKIELAVDPAGRLHLIAWEANLRELWMVEAWVRKHLQLIALACPERSIDLTGRCVRHVFTDAPASLTDLHGSDLHLHVLATVQVADRTGWYAAPLNAIACP